MRHAVHELVCRISGPAHRSPKRTKAGNGPAHRRLKRTKAGNGPAHRSPKRTKAGNGPAHRSPKRTKAGNASPCRFAVAAAALLFTLLTALTPVQAQQRITGQVITVDSVPVWKAIVTLRTLSDSTTWVRTLTDEDGRFEFILTGIDGIPPAPDAVRLEQNYPNPFAQGTTIRFTVAHQGSVQLAVYDRMGRRVRTLLAESLSAGRYGIDWDGWGDGGRHLASGLYHVLLHTADGARARVAALTPGDRSAKSTGLRREAGPGVLAKSTLAEYRLTVLDTVTALPRFVSTSISMQLGSADTSCTIIVPYGGWEDLEFPRPNARKLMLDAAYLYVAARSDGVWRRNVRTMSPWEYLGLGDTALNSLGGALDVDARGNRIVVGYDGITRGHPYLHDGVSVYRSLDAGQTWHRIDSTILLVLDSMEQNTITDVRSDPGDAQRLIAMYFRDGVFISENDGVTWRLALGRARRTFGGGAFWWKPGVSGICYFSFWTGMWEPVHTFQCFDTRRDTLLFSTQEPIGELEFSLTGVDHMYGIWNGGLSSSSDAGVRWQKLPGGRSLGELFYDGVSEIIYGDIGYKLMAFNLVTNTWHLVTASRWAMEGDYSFDSVNRYIYVIGGGSIHRISVP